MVRDALVQMEDRVLLKLQAHSIEMRNWFQLLLSTIVAKLSKELFQCHCTVSSTVDTNDSVLEEMPDGTAKNRYGPFPTHYSYQTLELLKPNNLCMKLAETGPDYDIPASMGPS